MIRSRAVISNLCFRLNSCSSGQYHAAGGIGVSRWVSSTPVKQESALGVLRKKTGFALNLCKKALEENEQDVSRAESWLKEEAARHGWATASKLQSRPTAEGLVGVFVDQSTSTGVLLEVNCETDFVARTDKFKTLVAQLTNTVADASIVYGFSSSSSSASQASSTSPSLLKKYLIESSQLDPFKEKLVTAISQLGENIVVKKALIVQPHEVDPPVKLTAYAHSVGGSSNLHEGIFMGKYGTLIAYSSGAEPDQEPLDIQEQETSSKTTERKEKSEVTEEGVDIVEEDALERQSFNTEGVSQEALSRLLCQHIVGLKPTKIRSSLEERKEEARLREIRKKAGTLDDEDDSDALLDQKFLLDTKITVRQLLKAKDMKVIDFVRLECGVSDQD